MSTIQHSVATVFKRRAPRRLRERCRRPGRTRGMRLAFSFGGGRLGQRVPYLARHLLAGRGSRKILAELCRIEREHLADGTLRATGFRLTATRHITGQPPQPRPRQAPCPPR